MAKTERTINCEICGQSAVARRANAKYCDVCRVLNSVKWLVAQKVGDSECWQCGEKFAPLRRGDVFCGNCADSAPSDATGVCGFCKKESTKLISKDVKVCRPCGTNPDNRKKLFIALYKKQTKLKEANGRQETSD